MSRTNPHEWQRVTPQRWQCSLCGLRATAELDRQCDLWTPLPQARVTYSRASARGRGRVPVPVDQAHECGP